MDKDAATRPADAASGFATGLERPIDLEVSKAGELYYLSRGSTGIVGKIGYSGGNP